MMKYEFECFNKTKELLKLENVPEYWENTWKTSMEIIPETNIPFLEDRWLLGINSILKLPEEVIDVLLGTARIIRLDPLLARFAWHCHYLLFETDLASNPWSCVFPSLHRYMGQKESLFYILILISGTDRILKFNEAKGIPHDVTAHTFSDLKLWMTEYFHQHGRWGLEKVIILWLIFHFTGRLYRLGRLQFVFCTCSLDIIVYRNKKDRSVIVLSAPGVQFRDDGQVDGTNDIYDREHAWLSQLKVEEGYVIGNPISPDGFAIRKMVELKEDEWVQVLAKGAPVLDIHIPGDSRMDHGECVESMRRAKEFFSRHFPERSVHAFTCTTWLFDAQYQKLLPESSNIVKFQKEFHLVPVLGYDNNTLIRVFGGQPADLSSAKRDTQLRRVILDHMAAGGHIRDTGGCTLMEDVDWKK